MRQRKKMQSIQNKEPSAATLTLPPDQRVYAPLRRAVRGREGSGISPLASTLKKYGMAVEDYHAMFARQGGVCPICLQRAQQGLCVDHDHKRRRRRALLCLYCNIGLGCYKDDPAAMRRGADYLEYWQQEEGPPIPAPAAGRKRRKPARPVRALKVRFG